MEPDFSRLDDHLSDADADGYLIFANDSDSDQLYLAGFGAPDPFTTLYTPEGTHLLVSGLEYGRAKSESRADTVSRLAEYDRRAKVDEHGAHEGDCRTLAAFLDDHGVETVSVPGDFPVGKADTLRELDVGVAPETDGVITQIRSVKTDAEIDHVRAAQRANEAAMDAAESLIAAADVEDGTFVYEGEPLTSERVAEEIEVTLLRNGCALDETIVACGSAAADPHDRGSGPLAADESIVVDIFPRDKDTKYHADMTRTFVKGDASDGIRDYYDVTLEAQEAAFDAIEPGATGAEVHDAVCDVYEKAGYPTLRSDETAETGFIHGTGHGVGLDVHELPHVSPNGDELEPGHVITVEPGLYDPDVGGVRIEDLVVVTEDGYENLTDYEKRLELE